MPRDLSPTSRIAYCEEVNEDDDPISRRTYAKSVISPSPTKERSNTGRSRKGPSGHSPSSPPSSYDGYSDEDAADQLSRRELVKSRPKDSRKNSKSGPIVVSKQGPPKRPGVRQSKTTGHIPGRSIDEASYYGVPQHPQTIVSRPRSRTRPESYYGQTARQNQRGPPMSHSAFYNGPPPPGGFAPQPFGPPSMFNGPPPPHMNLPMHPGPPGPPGPPLGHPPPMDFHGGPRELSARFGRPQSSMGFRPPSSYEPEPMLERGIPRKPSVSRKISKDHDDRMRMPPPPARPASARPSISGGDRLVFKAPPHGTMRRKSRPQVLDEDEDDEFDEEDDIVYRPDPRRISSGYGSNANPFASRRNDSYEEESDGDLSSYKREPAAGHARRRSSQFRGGLDEKTRKAMNYQDGVMTQSHGAPLTAEALKYIKNGGSTRSTRSTESRDESDWKHSATTRTTRSSNEEDDITIKLPRGGVIEVGGAKITCAAGGDVNIGRGNRHGSDRATERDTATINDEDEEEEEDDDDDFPEPNYRRKSRTMRTQKRLPAPEPHVGSYPRNRDPRSMTHPPALAQVPYNNYAPSSYGSGRRTPGPRGGQQAGGVYDPFPFVPAFDDEDEYEDDHYYPHPPASGPGYYNPQYNY
ncbi:uncharacterized protein B0I36DRAFT_101278 [Microdochium trichocladiopsis]|uniref:Uncharacterized protein n=1 Tax=Microdochium trichocladiopsis TaxID=1682393 RepID=A0A9P9BV12_9PEZI|nr:uncharacterized protein B0I36DRAFT_101278 [Microdochium trichocladiopsis]KAH7032847.1 hypothetical protein B0I36DRAFT_101278 [Microdochium trichocladiopsis]